MQRLIGLAVFSVIFFSAVTLHAAEVKGQLHTEVKTAAEVQTSDAALNNNQLAMGGHAKLGTVIQANKGALNKNEAAIASITD